MPLELVLLAEEVGVERVGAIHDGRRDQYELADLGLAAGIEDVHAPDALQLVCPRRVVGGRGQEGGVMVHTAARRASS